MKFPISDHDPVEQRPPYTALAKAYDVMMSHVDYRRWAVYMVQMFKREGIREAVPFLDVGCGTGRFIERMAALGWVGEGCDPSPEMINIARKHFPEARFFVDGLPELRRVPARRYPIITCLYDTINYITDPEQLQQSFRRVCEVLPPGGIFVFDVVSESHCRQHFQHYADSEVITKALAYSRESHYNSSERIQYNWIRIYTPEGIFEEEHQQRIYPAAQLRKIIKKCSGFTITHMYEDFTLQAANSYSGRIHFVLKKI